MYKNTIYAIIFTNFVNTQITKSDSIYVNNCIVNRHAQRLVLLGWYTF